MAWSIDTAFVQEFENRIHLQVAENPTAWRNAVRVRTGMRGKTYNVERLGNIELVNVAGRHADTPLTPMTHSRRRLTLSDRNAAELIDDLDEVKMLISPESDYATRFAQAYNRHVADIVIAALTGNSQAVDASDTVTTVALSQLAVPVGSRANAGVGANVIANGGTGLTMAKLRQANRVMDLNFVPRDGNRYIAVSPWAIEDLLADSTVTSGDFSSLQALQYGTFPETATWMGFKWIISNQLALAATVRTCIAWHKEAVVLAIARDFQTEIDKRPDKNNSTQVLVKTSIGATRVEEELVCSIDFVEA